MSRRPHVQSAHEKRVEREIQRARKARDTAARAGRGAPAPRGDTPEPTITCVGRGAPKEPIPRAVQAWIDEEVKQQLRYYRQISREMEALAPQRERWVAEFFERITGPRGFSVHAGARRTIPREELPERPRRPWRVVW